MPKRFWKSLRSRILLLAVLTLLFLAGAAFSFFAFLRSNQTETLASAERHLVTVASGLARNYTDRSPGVPSLSSVKLPSPPPPPPPEMGEPHEPPPPGLAPHPHPSMQPDPFSALTVRALRPEAGIEGGFYSATSGALFGYAFPTHEGPGPSKEMPQRERPTIEQLAHQAVSLRSTRTSRYEGPHDAILFVAVPVRESVGNGKSEITGAVWLMQRMPGITSGRSRQLLLGSLGFGAAALITALLTFFVTGEVRKGVNSVLGRLSALESGLFTKPVPATPDSHLAEFESVLQSIDLLAGSLHQKIQNERTLEAEMRHKERLSALGQFAAGIAHELRNPLATIRLRTQMSGRTTDLEGVARNSRVILEEIDRLDDIIGRLLYFARPIHLTLEPVSLDELCATTAFNWKNRQSGQAVEVSCGGHSDAVILCDRSRLLQVLDNLVENAVQSVASQATSENFQGTIILVTAIHGAFAEIQVMDNGAGLTQQALSHALDPFFTTKASGTGLGLSISFEIIEAHAGELTLGNGPVGGAIATIRLPLPAIQVASHSSDVLKTESSHV